MRAYTSLLLCFGLAACIVHQPPPRVVELRPADPGLRALFWMEGSWTTGEGEERTEEQWTCTDDATMVGINRVLRGGEAVSSEQLRIEKREDGIVYVAIPAGQEPTTFRAIYSGPAKVVFENPDHDFPTRITYWLSLEGHLRARIEGTVEGQPRAREWDWTSTR